MFYKFCLALLVTLASASVKELQYHHHPWAMQNDHQDPPSIIYVLPDSDFRKYQAKNLQTPVQEENPNRENHGWGKSQIHPRFYQNPSSINAMTPNFNPIHYPTHQLQTPVQKGAMNGEMWNKSPNRFQIQPLHQWETENYRHQNPSSNNAITLKFNLVPYPSKEMLQEQSKIGDISKKDSLDQKIEKCQVINSKLVVVSEKKCQDLEEMLSLSKKKETEFARENEVFSAKVKSLMQENKNQEEQLTGYKNKEKLAALSSVDKNNSEKIISDSDKKKFKELEEHSKKKEIEFAKEIEELNTKIEKLMQENKNQEEQLTEYKEKLAVLSSADKNNSTPEILNSKLLLESEKKKYQDLEEDSKNKESELTKENELLNTKVKSLMEENKNQEEQLTEYKEKLAVLSSADKNNSTQEILNSKLLLESEKKKYQDLEEISKKKEIELTKENETLNTKVQNLTQEMKNQEEQLTGYKKKEKLAVLSIADKNNSSQEIINCKLLLESEKKKYQDLVEVSKKKEIELTKEIEVLNTKVNSLLEVIQSQEKQLTGYKNKEKLAILTSAETEKNNSTQEMINSLESEKKKYQDLEEISKKKEMELTKENEALNTKVKSLTQEIQSQEEQLTGYKNREKLAILSTANFSLEIETLNNKIEMCNKETGTLRQSSETIAEENQKLNISLTDCKNRTLSVGNLDKSIGTPELKLGNNKNYHLGVNCDIGIPVFVKYSVIINATVHANSNCNWNWQFETSGDRILVFSVVPIPDHNFTEEEINNFFTIQDDWNGQTIRFEKPKLNNVTSKILPEVAYTSHSKARVRLNNPSTRPTSLIPQLKVQKALVCPPDLGDKTSQCGRLDDEVSCYCATFIKGKQSSQMNYCNNHQMKLLSIETKEKHKAIFSVWGQKYIFMTSGKGTKLDNGVKVWNWNSTGEKITYTNWLPGEPNNVFDHDVCIAAHSPGWDDIPCSGHADLTYEAICEAHP